MLLSDKEKTAINLHNVICVTASSRSLLGVSISKEIDAEFREWSLDVEFVGGSFRSFRYEITQLLAEDKDLIVGWLEKKEKLTD